MKQERPGQQVEVWFQDEARFGQQGTLTNVWALKGTRPTAVKQTEYEWVYLYASVNPVTGESVALLAPSVNTGTMDAHLRMISAQVGEQRHVVLVLDRAGWHVAKALKVPHNITLLHLPPYSPELNPVERVWAYLKAHYLSNRTHLDHDDLMAKAGQAWNAVSEERFRSVCRTAWVMDAGAN